MSAATFPPVRKDRVRLIGLMAKKPGLSDEEFFKHWHEVHGPLFSNLEVTKKNLLKYEQVRSLVICLDPYPLQRHQS